jgi:hypothetical protein
MSSFPGSPQVLKGAIIGMDLFNPLASVIIFQYNPDTMTRTLTAQTTTSDNADKREALRLKGPLPETNELTVEIEAESEFKQPNIGTFVPSQKQESRWTGKCCSSSRENIRRIHNPSDLLHDSLRLRDLEPALMQKLVRYELTAHPLHFAGGAYG